MRIGCPWHTSRARVRVGARARGRRQNTKTVCSSEMADAGKRGGGNGGDSRRKKARYMVRPEFCAMNFC